MHVGEEQYKRENINVSFSSLLSEPVFAGNAMIHVGGRTPYQVVYGRQPQMLPNLLFPGDGEEGENATGIQQARVREIALARVSRSLKTRATPSGHSAWGLGRLPQTTVQQGHFGVAWTSSHRLERPIFWYSNMQDQRPRLAM